MLLVYLERTKNSLVEVQRRHGTDESRHEEQSQTRQSHVSKVQDIGCKRVGLELSKVPKRVQKDPCGRGTRIRKGTPPPVVVFVAELEIVEEQGDLRARNDQDEKDQKQKSKDIVVVVHPHRGQNEIQLYKASPKRKEASNDDRKRPCHEPWLVRNLARNVRGLDGVLDRVRLVSKIGSDKDERRRDSKPKDNQHQHGRERNGIAAPVSPGNQIQKEEESKAEAGESQRRTESGVLPCLALEGLVQARRDVSVDGSHEDKKQELGHQQSSASRRRQEPHSREQNRPKGHAQQLSSRSAAHRKKAEESKWAVGRYPRAPVSIPFLPGRRPFPRPWPIYCNGQDPVSGFSAKWQRPWHSKQRQ
mmetsp:Transcript_4849/g.11574  ORF Transcript_4849/g.11574 Transcript_4849/m.11574 type:complete len:361 (+) Transcript_4849:164-1246(+)